ncbi:hypothetical protein [Hymenobacter psychrotolerans]|uniref:hypothetical protein n=1 Tax=Hymenobacter psychrotolerans TaxID=344998 RepID=UPI0011148B11|nr:hypothetical protein [Hymenobacter psychrotolerans]
MFGPSDTRLLVGSFGASSVLLGVLLLLAVVLVFSNITATRSYSANRHWYNVWRRYSWQSCFRLLCGVPKRNNGLGPYVLAAP